MKALRTLVILLLIAVLVAVGAEFGVRAFVQNRAQQLIQASGVQVADPTVNLGGPSVLLALAQGRFVQVDGTASSAQVPFEQRKVPVQQISYRGSEIRVLSPSSGVVGLLDVNATLDYRALSDLAGQQVSHSAPGRLQIDVQYLGVRGKVSGVPVLDVAKQQLTLGQARVEVAGVQLDETQSQQLVDRVAAPISVAVDRRLTITSIAVTEAGLGVSMTGRELPFGQ